MADRDALFWPSLYGRLAPTRYRPAALVDSETEALEADEGAGGGLDRFFIDFETLRAHVEVELQSLLNANCLEAALVATRTRGAPTDTLRREEFPFEGHPSVRASILNYGLPAFVGRNLYAMQVSAIEERLRAAIEAFEPRIRSETMRVRVAGGKGGRPDSDRELSFEIEGEILGADQTLRVVINTFWDSEKVRTRVDRVDVGR